MDDDGTKVLPKQQPPLQFSRTLPKEIDIDIMYSEGGPQNEVHDVNESEGTERQEQALLDEEAVLQFEPQFEKVMEGKVEIWNEATRSYEKGYYIVLQQQQLSVYEGLQKEGELLHVYQFPQGAEYRFSNDDQKLLYIYQNNTEDIRLRILDKQLFNYIWMEWLITSKIITDFKSQTAIQNANDVFDEKNLSLKFNPPSFREFGNVYNEKYMTPFYYYPIVDGKPQIKNAVEFQHFYRPNRLMTRKEQQYGEDHFFGRYNFCIRLKSRQKIEEYMTNKDRKFIQWAPSRDWSRLFILSSIPFRAYDVGLYVEFYNFNYEEQTILSSPLRINFLSQLLRPQWIQYAGHFDESNASEGKIKASFTADTLVIRKNKTELRIIYLNPDGTFKKNSWLVIKDAKFESIKVSCSKFYVKSDGLYYEQSVKYIYDNYFGDQLKNISFDKDFKPNTTLKNIIQCGIYDILVFDEHVKIFSNIEPLNESREIKVDDGTLKLLHSNKFIELDHHSIACLPQPLNDDAIRIKIIEISNDNLVMKEIDIISLKSPLNTQASDCLFNLIKFKDSQYVVFIVTLPSKHELLYQCYKYVGENDKYEFAYQQPVNGDLLNLQQIPHLPLVTFNGNLFMNCDPYINNYQLEIDLRLDETQILYYDQDNISSQEVEVYHPNFKELLCRIIEENQKIIDKQTQSDRNIYSIEIPEFKTQIIIESRGEYSKIIIFEPLFDKIKQLSFKKPIRYKTHKVIYRDVQYKVSIILSAADALYQMQMCFDHTGVTLKPLNFIMSFTEEQKEHEIYQHDDFSVSLFIPAPDCSFKTFSFNSKDEQEKTIKIDFKDEKKTIAQLSQFIQIISHSQSIQVGKLFLQKFKSIIFKNIESYIEKEGKQCVFALQNKIIIFEKGVEGLTIIDDQFTVIGTVILGSKFPLSNIRIASSIDYGALEYIDQFYSKFPFPIQWNIQDYKSYNERLNYYLKTFSCPMPLQFGFHEGLIPHLDLQSEKLLFFNSNQDKKDGKVATRIEIIAQRDSFIDEIANSKERKEIEDRMNDIEINLLLSYNINKRMNLITGTKNHPEKGLIYSVLQKRLENADIKELPMLIYNTSVDPNNYESILDILNENKAIKLARLIVSIAIQQDQIGYIYSRLYQYLEIFSASELQMFFESQIFFFQIPTDCYEEYQVSDKTLVKPYSDKKTFPEIRKYMKDVESQIIEMSSLSTRVLMMIMIKRRLRQTRVLVRAVRWYWARVLLRMLAILFFIPLPYIGIQIGWEQDYYYQDLERMIEEIFIRQSEQELNFLIKEKEAKEIKVPIEYFAINLQEFIRSNQEQKNQSQKEVAKMLNNLAERDATILEKESIKIIIDFKWDTYAQKFFSIQLGLFICFIIAFIVEVVGVSKNSHIFSNDDSNQTIPRMISITILIPFAIYEIANIVITKSKYFESFWNLNDLLLIFVYATYFTMTFKQPDQLDVLKSLQLLIVIFSFIKFSFLIRIWTKVSFLVRMLIVVFKELLIFLFFFLLVIGGFTVMAQIIIKESGDEYNGIKLAAYLVIVLRQAIGDFDTSSIIEGTQEFKILAWLLWFLILIIGNIVFMNFIIAVVSESYEFCMEKRVQLIYSAKLEMIKECEDLMPNCLFKKENWFPKFIIIRREQGSSEGGENSNEWLGFVAQMKRHLENETTKLKEIIDRSTDNTKKEMKKVKEEVKTGQEEMKKEMKTGQEEMKAQINQINLILTTVFKDQIADIKAKEVQANNNKAI